MLLWQVCTMYQIDLDSLFDLYPFLCGIDAKLEQTPSNTAAMFRLYSSACHVISPIRISSIIQDATEWLATGVLLQPQDCSATDLKSDAALQLLSNWFGKLKTKAQLDLPLLEQVEKCWADIVVAVVTSNQIDAGAVWCVSFLELVGTLLAAHRGVIEQHPGCAEQLAVQAHSLLEAESLSVVAAALLVLDALHKGALLVFI